MGSGNTHNKGISSDGMGNTADSIHACNDRGGVSKDDSCFPPVIRLQAGSEAAQERRRRRSGKSEAFS